MKEKNRKKTKKKGNERKVDGLCGYGLLDENMDRLTRLGFHDGHARFTDPGSSR